MNFTKQNTTKPPPPPWSVKTRRAPSGHCRDARVYGHTISAMHDMGTLPPGRKSTKELRPPPALVVHMAFDARDHTAGVVITDDNAVDQKLPERHTILYMQGASDPSLVCIALHTLSGREQDTWGALAAEGAGGPTIITSRVNYTRAPGVR